MALDQAAERGVGHAGHRRDAEGGLDGRARRSSSGRVRVLDAGQRAGVPAWSACAQLGLVGLLQFVVLPLDDRLAARSRVRNFSISGRAALAEHLVGDQIADAARTAAAPTVSMRLELDDLVAARGADRLRDLARPSCSSTHSRSCGDISSRVDRPDQAAVGLRRRRRSSAAATLGEVLAGDDARARALRPSPWPRRPGRR